jgi:hypothetical protein
MRATNAITICMLFMAFLLSSSCEPGYRRDRDRYDRTQAERSLVGNWYVNGDQSKRAEIVLAASGLEARNEKGETSRLAVEQGGEIRALDWGELRGDVRRDIIIDWANGTTWTRESPR